MEEFSRSLEYGYKEKFKKEIISSQTEKIPYLEDLKVFLSVISKEDSKISLNDLPIFLQENPEIKEKFVNFFDQEFQKQIQHFEVYEKLDESLNNPEIRNIVPQISYVFSCPNLDEIPVMRKYLRDLNDPKKRNEKIKNLRKLHNLENPSQLKISQTSALGSLMKIKILKNTISKVPGVNRIQKVYDKGAKTIDNLKKSNVISSKDLKTLSDPSKVMESVKNLNPSKIKEELMEKMKLENIKNGVKNNLVDYKNSITGGLDTKLIDLKNNIQTEVKEYRDNKNQQGECESLKDDRSDYNQPLLEKNGNNNENAESLEVKNLNIDEEQQYLSNSKSENVLLNNESDLSDSTDNVTNKTPLLEKSEDSTNSENSGEKLKNPENTKLEIPSVDPDFYLQKSDIKEEEFEKFLILIFDKLDESKKIILEKSIVSNFPKVPDNFIHYFESDESISEINLYFVLISYFAAIVNYFTGLKSKFYIDEADCFNIDFYLDEIKLKEFAKNMNYKTQYRIISNLQDFNINEEEEKIKTLDKNELIQLNQIPYEELDEDNISHFPPYVSFNDSENCINYYRRYDSQKADNHHSCELCCNLQQNLDRSCVPKCNSSYFRHIDKQRIVYNSLNGIMDIRKLIEKQKKNKFIYQYLFLETLYVHNYESYDEYISQPNILKTYATIFENREVVKMNNNLRNFIGEEFGFYYFWITHLIKMLVFPSLIGVLITFGILLINYYGEEGFDVGSLDLYFTLPFSCFIIIWSKIYLQSWQSREKFYRYSWGMNEFFLEESISSKNGANAPKYKKFLDIIFPEIDTTKVLIKRILSWLTTFILFAITIGLNCFIFWLQDLNINHQDNNNLEDLGHQPSGFKKLKYQQTSYFWIYLIPVIMYFMREMLTFLYYKLSKKLTKWEGHTNNSDHRNSFVLKASFFQFFNYYFNLYYIAFVKRFYDSCLYDNCKDELSSHLTIILVTAILDDLRSLLWTIYNTSPSKINALMSLVKYENKADDNNGSNKDQFYERSIYEEKNADKEFVQIIMTYGYIIQFGTSSPICFLFAIFQAFIARIVDSLKMTKYSHVNLIDGSNGLGSHIKIISFLNVIGMITNITINLFVDERVAANLDSSSKWLILFAVENFLLIITFFINFDTLPYWFKFKNKSKTSYLTSLNKNKELTIKKKQ